MADFRVIPSIEQMRQRAGIAALEREHGRQATIDALRRACEQIRAAVTGGASYADAAAAAAAIEALAARDLALAGRPSLVRVINATGVIVHTNLGRAPLAATALERAVQVAGGYSNLEFDLGRGQRGSRAVHAAALLTTLTGAEAAVVVNNNAAATLLVLAALANGREVVISRGELVEIGGGFRIPDVLAQSGAILREVGTTNRTRVGDYVAATGPRTAMWLRVHPSNFTISGFTEKPPLDDLVAAARTAGVPLVEDLGSGCLVENVSGEPSVQQSVSAGIDLVCFSGDKMLGGPQAGIVVGRRALAEQLQRHPLMRALRVDKLTIAALEATLIEYRAGRASSTIPVMRMIEMPVDAIRARAEQLADRLRHAGWRVELVPGASTVGGGSAPGIELPTVLVALDHRTLGADALDQRLREQEVPVVARIENDRVVLDLRTVFEEQDGPLGDALVDI